MAPRLDSGSRELLLIIDARDAKTTVSNFKLNDGSYVEDLQVRLEVLSEQEKRRYLSSQQFAELWNSSGSFQNRIIEKNASTDFFRVYRRVEYPNSWEVFTVSPDSASLPTDLFSFWIGHCLTSHSTVTQSGMITLCRSYVVIGDVAANFTISSQNLANTDSIRGYLANLVTEWEKGAR